MDELAEVGAALARCPVPVADGIVICSVSGGAAAHVSDLASLAGLSIPRLSAETQAALGTLPFGVGILGFVPEERRADGLVLTKSVAFNVGLANLGSLVFSPWLPFIVGGRRRSLAQAMVRDLAIKTPDIETPVDKLSGGNQQKVLIGRWLGVKPKVLILDEPTRGVDIGARGEIHRLVRNLAQGGMAVLVISSEPEELPDLCDRVLVMYLGKIVESGPAGEVFEHPLHPYTQALVAAVPRLHDEPGAHVRLSGEPRSPIDPDPNVCRFYGRAVPVSRRPANGAAAAEEYRK